MSVVRRITPRIVRRVAERASTSNNRLHVLPREGKWVVRKDGSARVSGVYITKDAALRVARQSKSEGKTNYIVVHDSTGNVVRVIP